MSKKFNVAAASPLLCLACGVLPLQTSTAIAAAADSPVSLSAPIVTRHRGTFNGRRITYTAMVEAVPVVDTAGHPAARLVDVAYIAEPVHDAAHRPVLFAFNGGPIAPSNLIHLGALGPKRLAIPEDPRAEPSHFALTDNTHALLDVADLVFFDPANTGFSRTLEAVDPKSYFSVKADGQQLTQFVIEWSKAHGRVDSPKYLIGESYGTLRAAEAANQLQNTSCPLAGIVLLGQAVNIIEYAQRPANIISYVVSLPTLAAIAWAHDRADRQGRSFEQFISDAQAYARGDYLSVLFLGNAATTSQRESVAKSLQAFTGIASSYYLAHALKITKEQYRRELFPGQLLGLNDARYIGPAASGDPFRGILRAYDQAFAAYLRDDLKAGGIGSYLGNPVQGDLGGWDWGPNKTPFGDWPYTKLISEVMEKNPTFRVLVGNGYYDTQTTVGAMDYLVSQADWPRDRVKTAYYQGGHMFYTVDASLEKLSQDIRGLITTTPASDSASKNSTHEGRSHASR